MDQGSADLLSVESLLEEQRPIVSHMVEGTQAIWPSKEVDRFEHVGRVRDSMLFYQLREESAGMVHAVRLLVVESRYLAHGLTEGRSFGAPQL